MTKDEALKMALEALESCDCGDYSTGHVIYPSFNVDAVNKAIDAIDEALAQPAVTESHKQEPVACDGDFPEGFDASLGVPAQALRVANAIMCDVIGKREWDVPCTAQHVLSFAQKYTTPPQRPSRSDIKPLTDEEYEALVEDLGDWSRYVEVDTAHQTLTKHVRQVLAAHGIKEKNT